jgi:hypothetical protein
LRRHLPRKSLENGHFSLDRFDLLRGKPTEKGMSMRKILTVSALLATSLTAFVRPTLAAPPASVVQTAQCQSVPKASDRLACYDRMNPPTAAGKPAPTATDKSAKSKTPTVPGKPATSDTPADQGQVVDMLAVENSKLDAKLKTICRGC